MGSGSAGAVLAARLSEKGDQTVLLLEGGHAYAAWAHPAIVASSDNVGGDLVPDWGCQTQPEALGHAIATPRSQVLGGDLQGRVHGLRVVDASSFPDFVSVATNVTIIAVTDKM